MEDLYRPYKQKRRTRATVAREKGLEPLAALLFAQERDCPRPEDAAAGFIDPEKGVETAADALQGASDIIAEWISDDAAVRKSLRELLERQGTLRSLAATEEDSVYRLYYDFEQSLSHVAGPSDPGHQPGREGGKAEGHCPAGPGAGAAAAVGARW